MTTKRSKRRSIKAGLSPGTMIHIGEEPSGATSSVIFHYSPELLTETRVENQEPFPAPAQDGINWLSVRGVHDVEIIRGIGELYGLHPLVMEDIVNTSQRPKLEDYRDYLFIVMKMLRLREDNTLETGQICIILGKNYVISFQEEGADTIFEPVTVRLRTDKGRIRTSGADYLTYALIDTIVDNYFNVLEAFGENVEVLEEELAVAPSRRILVGINHLKRSMIFMRKAIWPLREVTYFLERGDSALIASTSKVFYRDVYDHTIQVIDAVETYRDLVSGMLDLYLSSMSNRTNEVMKFLTVIGTIFMPLTFLVGVYGMNFRHMPELEWRYGYFWLWGFMALLTGGMILYFRKKRWL